MSAEIQYTNVDGIDIAYRVYGHGPRDVVFFPALISHLDLVDELPFWHNVIEHLSPHARVILFDRRGSGLSDRRWIGTAEERMDDLRAVLDAVGVERATVIAVADGGPLAILFAAMHPDRTLGLVLMGATARMVDDPTTGYDVGLPVERVDPLIVEFTDDWASGNRIAEVFGDESVQPAHRRWARTIANPTLAGDLLRAGCQSDARAALPLVVCPTFVLHHTLDPVIPVECGRYLAEHLEGCTYVELPHRGNVGTGAMADLDAEHITRFVLGADLPAPATRVLATVLFTDIVDSTVHAGSWGDDEWRRLLDLLDARTAEIVTANDGRVVKGTGDGCLATFDGPGRAVRATHAILRAAREIGIELRAGLHTGEVELRGDDVAGLAVHLAARIEAAAGAREVLVSRTVVDLTLGSDLRFEPRGPHALKGFEMPMDLYVSLDPSSTAP